MGQEKPPEHILDNNDLLDDHLRKSIQKRRKVNKKPTKEYTTVHENFS